MNPPFQARFTQGPVTRHLWEMAWPMVWGLVATMSFNAVDAYFIGKLGEEALAAILFTFPVIMVVTSIAIGLGAGASSSIARAMGGGDHHRVSRLATDAITLSTLISVVVCVLGWLTIDPLFTLLGAGPDMLPLIRQYMMIWYFSAPFLLVPMITLSALRALGFHRIQGVLMVIAAIMNALLDPLLMFGSADLQNLHGAGEHWAGWLAAIVAPLQAMGVNDLPALGIGGAAWATLVTRVVTLVVAGYVIAGRTHAIVSPWAKWGDVKTSWRTLFHVGFPAIISNLIIPVANTFVVWLVAKFGTAAAAGLSVAVRIEPLALIAFYALSGVVGPFCGQNKGAGQYDRVLETLNVIAKFCLGFGLLLAVLLFFGGTAVGRQFVESEQALSVLRTYLTIVPISYGAYGIVMSVNAMFNGLGLPLPGLMISFLRVMGIYIPLALTGLWLWGLQGIFVATAGSNMLVALVAYLWLRRVLREQSQVKAIIA